MQHHFQKLPPLLLRLLVKEAAAEVGARMQHLAPSISMLTKSRTCSSTRPMWTFELSKFPPSMKLRAVASLASILLSSWAPLTVLVKNLRSGPPSTTK